MDTAYSLIIDQFLFLKTESRYKNKLTAESCFYLHKILDSVKFSFKEIMQIHFYFNYLSEIDDFQSLKKAGNLISFIFYQ